MILDPAAMQDEPSRPDGLSATDGPDRDPLWRRLLPFGIAFGLVAFVVARLDLRAFIDHLARVRYGAFGLATFAFLVLLLAADTFATVLVYRRIVAPVRFRDFFVL